MAGDNNEKISEAPLASDVQAQANNIPATPITPGVEHNNQPKNAKVSPNPAYSDNNKQSKPRSERQREASRANGKQSRGPNTERGKSYSRRNAWKHGMLSRNPTVFNSMYPEDAEEFDKYLNGLIDYWKPAGPMEFMYVEIIATGYLRLARGMRYEKAKLQVGMALKSQEFGALPESGVDQTDAAIKDVHNNGYISDETLAELRNLQNVSPRVFEFNSRIVEARKLGSNSNEEDRQALLVALSRERTQRQLNSDELKLVRERVMQMTLDEVAIPDSSAWDRTLRYEKPVWRRIRQATEDLQRLQNRRRRQHHEDLGSSVGPGQRDHDDDDDRYQ